MTKSAIHCGSSDICTTKVVDEANKPRELDDSKRRRLCFGFVPELLFLSFPNECVFDAVVVVVIVVVAALVVVVNIFVVVVVVLVVVVVVVLVVVVVVVVDDLAGPRW